MCDRPGFIYAVYVESLGVCKIGFTHKPIRRFGKIRSSLRLHGAKKGAVAFQVRLLTRGSLADEKAAHEQLRAHRVEMPPGITGKTEWYAWTDEVRRWLDERS